MLNVICVNQDNYLGRGEEYVRKLRDGVRRHLTLPHRFIVLSNVPAEGWWAKLALFDKGQFEGRCLYFDLDTLIVGSLDEIAGYGGPFAGLSDFFQPKAFASGVMAWDADSVPNLWDAWIKAKRPSHGRGDGGFIEAMMLKADRLQNVFPGQIVSFKADCRKTGVPANARVVCFHGPPRPHQMAELMSHW